RFNQQLLAVAQAPYRVLVGRGIRFSFGQLDAARSEEVPYALLTRLAVHIRGVVGPIVKRRVVRVSLLVPDGQEVVERLLPRRRVDGGCSRQDGIEVEQHRIKVPECDRGRHGKASVQEMRLCTANAITVTSTHLSYASGPGLDRDDLPSSVVGPGPTADLG